MEIENLFSNSKLDSAQGLRVSTSYPDVSRAEKDKLEPFSGIHRSKSLPALTMNCEKRKFGLCLSVQIDDLSRMIDDLSRINVERKISSPFKIDDLSASNDESVDPVYKIDLRQFVPHLPVHLDTESREEKLLKFAKPQPVNQDLFDGMMRGVMDLRSRPGWLS